MKSIVAKLVLASAGAFTLSACATTGGGPVIPVVQMLTDYEAREVAGEITLDGAAPGFVPGVYEPLDEKLLARIDATTQGYPQMIEAVSDVLDNIVESGPRPDIRPRIAIRTSPSPDVRAEREDLIIFTTGYLAALTCDDRFLDEEGYEQVAQSCAEIDDAARMNALAFVVAHEYAHVLLNHPSEYRARQEELQIADSVTQLVGAVGAAASFAESFGAIDRDQFTDIGGGLAAAVIATPVLEAELYRGQFAPYARQAESDADFLAVDLLQSTGDYDPLSGAQYLRSLYGAYGSVVVNRVQAALDAAAERTAAEAGALAAAGVGESLQTGSFANTQRGFRDMALRRGIEIGLELYTRFAQSEDVHLYFEADQRIDAVDAYGAAFGVTRELPAASMAALAAAGANFMGSWQSESGPAAAVYRARLLLAQGDVEGARGELDAIGSEGTAVLEFLIARGEVEIASGDPVAAARWYAAAARRDDARLGVFRSLAAAYHNSADYDAALEAVDRAEERFGQDVLLTRRIQSLAASGAYEEAVAVGAGCTAAYPSGGEQNRCLAAIPAPPEPDGDDTAEPEL